MKKAKKIHPMMKYVQKQKEQIKSGDPMGLVHPAIQMEMDKVLEGIQIDMEDPETIKLEKMLNVSDSVSDSVSFLVVNRNN
eukprot:SAG11_NODE_12802_length_684_cov_1.331624_2_plen_81_part_00